MPQIAVDGAAFGVCGYLQLASSVRLVGVAGDTAGIARRVEQSDVSLIAGDVTVRDELNHPSTEWSCASSHSFAFTFGCATPDT